MAPIPPASLALLGGLSGVLYVAGLVVYRVMWGPVAHIPGPWHAKVSELWLATHVLRMRQVHAIEELFARYGPVVCLGPAKIAFIDTATMKTVYGTTSKFPKGPFYQTLKSHGTDHAMTLLDPAAHAIRRRAYSGHYTPSHIALFEGELQEFTMQVVERLQEDGGKHSFDCLTLFRHLMVDVNMRTIFDSRVGAVERWAHDLPDPLSTAINDWPKLSLMTGALPSWLWFCLSRIPHPRWQQFCNADPFLHEFVGSRVREVALQEKQGAIGDAERTSLLVRMLRFRQPSGAPLTEDEIMAELQAHTMAGSDTTATTVSYLFWELSRNARVRTTLQAELDDAMPDRRALPSGARLQALPYLAACIKEGLRLYAAAPGPLPRTLPPQMGAFDVLGYAVPKDAVVETQAWSVHRRPDVFAAPHEFHPERWLAETEEMKTHFLPFGLGGRTCGGQSLAMSMLRTIIAAVVRNFDPEAPPETTATSMAVLECFVIFPAGMEAKLIFKPRSSRE